MGDYIEAKDSAQHRIFRSDARLNSEEINELLGIRVRVERDQAVVEQSDFDMKAVVRMFRFAVIMLLLVAFAIIGSMYQLQIGPFYVSQIVQAATGS